MILFSLPDEVACGVLAMIWYCDIARLEMAVVKAENRKALLKIMSSLAPTGDPPFSWNNASLKWLVASRIRPSSIWFNSPIGDKVPPQCETFYHWDYVAKCMLWESSKPFLGLRTASFERFLHSAGNQRYEFKIVKPPIFLRLIQRSIDSNHAELSTGAF
jgi:hypothetical protein